jgi:flagellar M-ring protein FliF
METRLRQLRTQAVRLLDGFTPGQKAMLGVAAAVLVVGGFLFTSWASRPSYTPLYTDLDPTDAAAVTEALDGDGTSYRLADGGRTVLVPRNRLYDVRLDLSAQGLPNGGEEGYGLLDNQGITASEFRQRVDYQRALSGELAKTIEAMDKVADASVQIVIPEQDLFVDDDKMSTAAVLLVPRGSAGFTATEVESIVHLVAGSVEGLNAQNVTVTDNRGNLLSAAGEDGNAALQGDRRAQQTAAFEQRVAARVQQQLESVLGSGNARVAVAAELDFAKRQTTREDFEPGTPLAENETNETFEGTTPAVGGPLGEDEIPVELGENNNYERTENQTTFANDKVTEVIETAPGAVERMAISVFVNSAAGVALPAGTIEQQVTAAAGLDAARGDDVQVSLVAFDDSAAAAAEQARLDAEAAAEREDMLTLARTVGTLLLVGIGLLVGFRRMRGGRVEEQIPLGQLALEPASSDDQTLAALETDLLELDEEELMELEPAEAAALAAARRQGPTVEIEEDQGATTVLRTRRTATQLDRLPGMEEREAAHADIADLIDRQPDDVAQLLRSWMADIRRSR